MRSHRIGRDNLMLPARTNRSATATIIATLGLFMFRFAIATAAIFIIGGGCFAIFAQEPLWSRLLTVVALGLVPALLAYICGWLIYLMMFAVSGAYDPLVKQVGTFSGRTTFILLALIRVMASGLISLHVWFGASFPGFQVHGVGRLSWSKP